MKASEIEALVADLGPVVKEAIANATVPLQRRIEALEARAAKNLAYEGIWQRAQTYQRGAGVTHKGALWSCTSDSATDEPGTSGAWQLVAKGEKR